MFPRLSYYTVSFVFFSRGMETKGSTHVIQYFVLSRILYFQDCSHLWCYHNISEVSSADFKLILIWVAERILKWILYLFNMSRCYRSTLHVSSYRLVLIFISYWPDVAHQFSERASRHYPTEGLNPRSSCQQKIHKPTLQSNRPLSSRTIEGTEKLW